MNRLFVAKKPIFMSSNKFLNTLKRKYKVKKAGFSGTLDPFAKGVLIIAFGKYTSLFNYLKKTPKVYKATIFLGCESESLDIEKVSHISSSKKLSISQIQDVLNSFIGEIEQIPPKYSAIKINGQRAYNLARKNINFEIPKRKVTIFDIKLTNYSHPFLSFEAKVSEGTYIRSLADDIATKLNTKGCLSYLERTKEGIFEYENEKALNPLNYLNIPKNEYTNDINNLLLGKKLEIKDFLIKDNGVYFVEFDKYFAIIEIIDNEVKYKLNLIPQGSEC